MGRKILKALLSVVGFIFVFAAFYIGAVGAQTSSGGKLLSVVVMVQGNTTSIKGYCVYVKDGEEIRKELKKDNAWGWNFRGEYIKEVKIQKVSGDASYKVYVIEGQNTESADTVFESDYISSTEPVVYKRNP